MNKLGYRAGDWAEVRSTDEILASLDERGCLDGLPFMPEMLQHCGRRFRIFKSAHKTCDTIATHQSRHMRNAVHLEGLRCGGEAHSGCQAGCLLFWKEAWLKPVRPSTTYTAETHQTVGNGDSRCDLEKLASATRVYSVGQPNEDARYFCQATEILRATTPLRWWDLRHYVKDLSSGNVRLRDFVKYVLLAAFNVIVRLHPHMRLYPYMPGLLREKTPTEVLNLQPGELVQIRSNDEIMRTLNTKRRNRGLWFDVEMGAFCGETFPVLRRVEKIIDDKTGRLINLPSDCIILEDVMCSGCLSRNRLFCPRSIYPYWREIWLKRTNGGSQSLQRSSAGARSAAPHDRS